MQNQSRQISLIKMEAVSLLSSSNPKLPIRQWFSTNYRCTTTRKLVVNAKKGDCSNEAGESLDNKKPISLRINIKKTKKAALSEEANISKNKDLPRGGGPPSEKLISRYDNNNEEDVFEAVEFLRSYFVKNMKPSAAAFAVGLIALFAVMSTIPIFSHESVFLENLLNLGKGLLQAGFHVYIDIDF
ncbi:hypothetical protein ABFS83_12G025500 [Erythranthe nasuta]